MFKSQIGGLALNRRKWSEMGPEWSPGLENRPPGMPRPFSRLWDRSRGPKPPKYSPNGSSVGPKPVQSELKVYTKLQVRTLKSSELRQTRRGLDAVWTAVWTRFGRGLAAGPVPEARKWLRHAWGLILRSWRPFWTHFGPFSSI